MNVCEFQSFSLNYKTIRKLSYDNSKNWGVWLFKRKFQNSKKNWRTCSTSKSFEEATIKLRNVAKEWIKVLSLLSTISVPRMSEHQSDITLWLSILSRVLIRFDCDVKIWHSIELTIDQFNIALLCETCNICKKVLLEKIRTRLSWRYICIC